MSGDLASSSTQTDFGLTLHGRPATYATGLVDVADGVCAWLQPGGDWGESNAGLIIGDGAATLIDTAWDLRLTRKILAGVSRRTDVPLTTVVATHGDGDHVHGFQLLPGGVEIVASQATAGDIAHEDPAGLRRSSRAAGVLGKVGLGAPRRFGRYVASMLGPYDLRGIELRAPDRTFEASLELEVGGRELRLRRLGPAHSAGDTIVHVPDAGVVFAGDLLFIGVTPNSWTGPIAGWRRALEVIGDLDASVVVPGHGPVGDGASVALLDQYWAWIESSAGALLARGTSVYDTALQLVTGDDFAAQPWSTWASPERTFLNVEILARERSSTPRGIAHGERAKMLWQVAKLDAAIRKHRG